jgi:hypothetical protein
MVSRYIPVQKIFEEMSVETNEHKIKSVYTCRCKKKCLKFLWTKMWGKLFMNQKNVDDMSMKHLNSIAVHYMLPG